VTELTIPVAGGASTYVEEVTVAASPFREAEPGVPSQSVLGSRELLALRGVLADDPFCAVQTLLSVTTEDDFKGEFAGGCQRGRDRRGQLRCGQNPELGTSQLGPWKVGPPNFELRILGISERGPLKLNPALGTVNA
jgi:hypothetical protein